MSLQPPQRTLKNKGVTVRLHTKAEHLEIEEGKVRGVKTSNGTTCPADAVIIATGGYSYQTTGSTGDGYRFAKKERTHDRTIVPIFSSYDRKKKTTVCRCGDCL